MVLRHAHYLINAYIIDFFDSVCTSYFKSKSQPSKLLRFFKSIILILLK